MTEILLLALGVINIVCTAIALAKTIQKDFRGDHKSLVVLSILLFLQSVLNFVLIASHIGELWLH